MVRINQLPVTEPSPSRASKPLKVNSRSRRTAAARGNDGGWFWQNVRSSLPLVASDFLGLAGASCCAMACAWFFGVAPTGTMLARLLLIDAVALLGFACQGLYPACGMDPAKELKHGTIAIAQTFTIAGVAGTIWGLSWSGTTLWGIAFLFSLLFVPALRMVTRALCARTDWWPQPVVVLHNSSKTRRAFQFLQGRPTLGLRPIRWNEQEPIGEFASTHQAERVMVDMSLEGNSIGACSLIFRRIHVLCHDEADFPMTPSLSHARGRVGEFECAVGVRAPVAMYFKRVLDLGLILLSLPLLAPIMACLAMAVRLSSEGNILFGQDRLGRNGRPFKAWKFRTMVPNAEEVLERHLEANPSLREEWEQTHKLKSDPRVTAIGKFLRKTSLDELPQLWNVVKDEMSLCGPRPIPLYEVSDYCRVHPQAIETYEQVRPGLTGYWQISGRNNTSYEERIHCDMFYVRNWSNWLDLYILLRTFKTVLLREGAC